MISVYAPQAGRPQEEKEVFYTALNKHIKNINKKGPYLIMGDWNARLQEAENEEEELWIGPHTFDRNNETTWQKSDEVSCNRELMLETCRTHNLVACNTKFEKPPD